MSLKNDNTEEERKMSSVIIGRAYILAFWKTDIVLCRVVCLYLHLDVIFSMILFSICDVTTTL